MKHDKTIELTITPNYVSDWDFCDAIRELIQNGTDQQTLDPANVFDISYDESENTLQLSSSKSILEIETLLLGCSTKTNDSDTVGQFGEGYKIAALVLNRIGKTFTVYNNGKNEIWISDFEQSKTFNTKVLTFKIYDHATDNEGLVIEVENVSHEEYEELFDVWLDMPGGESHKKIETTYGSIFTDEDMQGKVFVNELAIECKSGMHFGYNFKPKYITLERDRKSCNSWDMSKVTADMITEALNSGSLDIKEIVEIAKSGTFSDISYLRFKTWDSNVRKISEMFINEFDEENANAIPVSSQADYDHVKQMGGKPVIVPYEIAQIVSDIANERIDKLAENIWSGDYTTKEKLQQWNIAPLWNRSGDEYDMDHQHKAIIATGDREQRAEVRLLRQMDSGKYCDCCGRRINLIPWDKEIGLCRKCDEHYQRTNLNNDKCLWRRKQNRT